MKKFLSKKPVMITFVAVAVLMLVFYIAMLVRPVAIGMTYKGEASFGIGTKVEMTVKVKNSSEVDVKISAEGTSIEMEDMRYVCHDRQLYIMIDEGKMTDEQFKNAKKEIIENWETLDKVGALLDVNAFKAGDETDTLTCAGSIVFAAIGGVVTVALLGFATLSVLAVVKKK